MTGTILELFAGPGGMSEGARMVGLDQLTGIELDPAACATRAAAGHDTIRADVAAFSVDELVALLIIAVIGSPPCTTFSAAGRQAGNALTAQLARLIRDLFAGRDTRGARRREMGRVLHAATPMLPTTSRRAHKIAASVRSAALVAEPARYIAATRPEWVALEQVPAVLPLWQVYAGELRKLGYSTWCGVLNAADYGVPQTRQRAILIASRVRTVRRPEPTHYDPRKGMQLWGTPWVSMAEALGWGAAGRPAPTTTAGGTRTGGAEPFGRGGRDALAAEQDSGRWVVRTSFGQPRDTKGNGSHEMDAAGRPSHAVTTKARSWTLHTNRDQRPDGSRQTADPQSAPAPAPAPALTAKTGGQWLLRMDAQAKATVRPASAPAPALKFGHAANEMQWVHERPATTVQGDPRVGRPGHKDRDRGESQFGQDSVRITPAEAATLQSFPPGYPFQGTKTAQFTQIGNAVPPLLAAHFLAAAAGVRASEAVA